MPTRGLLYISIYQLLEMQKNAGAELFLFYCLLGGLTALYWGSLQIKPRQLSVVLAEDMKVYIESKQRC